MKQKFESIEELVEWCEEHKPNINYVHVEWDDAELEESIGTITTSSSNPDEFIVYSNGTTTSNIIVENTTPINIQLPEVEILSFSLPENKLSVNIEIVEGQNKDKENIWYVDSFESMPDTCMTGKIEYNGNNYFMNICESDGAKVELLAKVDGTPRRYQFKLETCNSEQEYDMILYI